MDFNPPKSEMPDIFCTLSIPQLDALMENPSLDPLFEAHGGKVDILASFSSLEHDGLGRYGDPMDPFGDIKRMRKLRRYLKPEGVFFLAVPTGGDRLFWNAHRVYGNIRFPMLIEGWQLLGIYNDSNPAYARPQLYTNSVTQPVHVLRVSPE